MHPIFSSLLRHKVIACMVIVEIAMVYGVLTNATNIYASCLRRTSVESGIDGQDILDIWLDNAGSTDEQNARTRSDLATISQVPGVERVASTSSPPLTGAAWTQPVKYDFDQATETLEASSYGGQGLLETVGAKLVAGRFFVPSDYVDQSGALSDTLPKDSPERPRVAVIPEALATRLWPETSALGKSFVFGQNRLTVVGVVKHFAQPDHLEAGPDYSVIMPFRMSVGFYAVRTEPLARRAVIKAIEERILATDPRRIVIQAHAWEDDRESYFSADSRLASTIIVVCATLVVVTASGLGGLTMFWVSQRRRQIGIRRALGARHSDIRNYFQMENLVLVLLGLLLGVLPAVGISELLFLHYGVARLGFYPIVLVALLVCLIGQASAFLPAIRASRTSPAESMQRA